MSSDQLFERRVNTFLTAVLVFFTTALWLSVIEIRNNMNAAAKQESISAVRGSIKSLQEQVSLIASDYNNWTDVFEAAEEQSISVIASNYGITAVRGDVFEYAAMFGGPFKDPVAWIAGGSLIPQAIFLPRSTIDAIALSVTYLNTSERQTSDFFEVVDGEVVILSASYLLPEASYLLKEPDSRTAIAVIGKVLTRAKLSEIEQELSVSQLRFGEDPGSGEAASIKLFGAAGGSIGVLTWMPPTPGTVLFERLFAIFLGVNIAFAAVIAFGAQMIHRQTAELLQKQLESDALARIDVLTGLPNRLALSEVMNEFSEGRNIDLLILAIDIDRFKQINDLIGHTAGDAYLVALASRLKLLQGPSSFVARIGGDEFVAIFFGDEPKQIYGSPDPPAFLEFLSVPLSGESLPVDVTVSQGIASSQPGGHPVTEVLRRADRAMYHAKAKKARNCVWYDESMEAEDRANKEIEAALRKSLKSGSEFLVVYQPIVSANNTRSLAKAEALARWNSSALGSVSPSDFIRVAEGSGLINALGWIILDMVCRDLVAFRELTVCVNVSPIQLMTPGFSDEFRRRVAEHNVEPKRIEIEVTENVALVDDSLATAEIQSLSDAGFGLSLDDFGTGFSSISYLSRVPLNMIKIDRCFVSGEIQGRSSGPLIAAIVSMAHSIGVSVVAEGVETESQLRTLKMYGCDLIQGYHTGRPVPIETLADIFDLNRVTGDL